MSGVRVGRGRRVRRVKESGKRGKVQGGGGRRGGCDRRVVGGGGVENSKNASFYTAAHS